MKSKKLIWIALPLLLASGVAYWLKPAAPTPPSMNASETSAPTADAAPAGVTAETGAPAAGATPVQAKIDSEFKQLHDYFPKNAQGEALAHVTALAESMDESDEGLDSEFYRKQIELLEQNPKPAFAAIKSALDKLPGEFSGARQELMQFAASLEVDRDSKQELLLAEAKRPAGKGGAGDATVALETLFSLSNYDARSLEPVLTDVLDAHRGDKETQRELVATYSSVDPERSEQLKSRYGL
jgi:hypothetical protein